MALIPLQALASQGTFALLGDSFDLVHELLHDEVKIHHHDEDGTIHFNDSQESMKHHSEHAANAPLLGLLPVTGLPVVTLTVLSRVPTPSVWYLPNPYLETPQRPPQPLA
jgi:hypothetical protein